MSLFSFLKKLKGAQAGETQQELSTAEMNGGELRDEALGRPVRDLVKKLQKLPAEAADRSFKTPTLDAILSAEIPPAVRESKAVKEALGLAVNGLVDGKKVPAAHKLLEKFGLPAEEENALVLAALVQELKKPDFGLAGVVASYLSPPVADFNSHVIAAANREAAAGRLDGVCVTLSHLRQYLMRSDYAQEKIPVQAETKAAFKTAYLALLKTGQANSVPEQFAVEPAVLADPEIRSAALAGLSRILESDAWYNCFRLVRDFGFSPGELQAEAVQKSALVALERRINGDMDELTRIKEAFKPDKKALEESIIRGLDAEFAKYPYAAHTAARALEVATAENFSGETLASPACQAVGTQALVAKHCHYHASNWGKDPLHWKFEEQVIETFKLTPENQERARVIAAGRIYGCLFDDCWHVHLWPELPDEILKDRSGTGKLRDFPVFLRRLIETFDIRTFKQLEEFRSENGQLLRKLAEHPDEEPKQALSHISAMQQLHLTPIAAEKLLEAGVNLAPLAAARDFKKLWKELTRIDENFGSGELFKEAAEFFGYERIFRHLREWQRLEPYEGLGRFSEVIALAKVSGLEPAVFYDRIIAPAVEARPEAGAKRSHGLYTLHKSILHTAQLPEVLAQYPDGALPPQIKMVTDRLVAEYPDLFDIFKSWESFSGFVSRYHMVFNNVHYGADRPYANPPMADISIYEANGIRPEDVTGCC